MGMVAARLEAELTTPVDAAARDGAAVLAAMGRPAAVLYYGSTLRAPDPGGMLDFYVLVDRLRDWPGGVLWRAGLALLPPNVGFLSFQSSDREWRAKYAVLTVAQFRARARLKTRDTSIWARFCQPVRLVWVRDPRAADVVLGLVRACVLTASVWAARLGPTRGTALAFWTALLGRTYAAELRVERAGRAAHLLKGPLAERASAILPEAWAEAGIDFQNHAGVLVPHIVHRARSLRRWRAVQRTGRPRNVARLIKAAFTFDGGADYIAWKIARHTGVALNLNDFVRRHPLLGLPLALPQIRKAFMARRAQ